MFMLSKKHCFAWPGTICCCVLLLVLAACSSSIMAASSSATKVSSQTVSKVASVVPKLGAPGCLPPSPVDQSSLGFPEAHGTAKGMDVWVLLLGGEPRAKQDMKIIWRMMASTYEPLHLVGIGPKGLHIRPLFGPEIHSGSNWSRPGGEWGSGFNFPVAGCWDLHVTLGTSVGDVWLVVS
jgi:hypothetical protein